MPLEAKTIVFTKPAQRRPVIFLKAMPKGGVDTGPVYRLTDAMGARYDADPSVLDALLKEVKERDLDKMEGDITIKHPKGFTIGIWNGALSTLDP